MKLIQADVESSPCLLVKGHPKINLTIEKVSFY